ncbi:MAG TPA: galactosyltransferase-related protein [Candidatus Acidoferrum sp.]|nr:galactosyltransferase-related protein [Candidatus Acidoferrum sp.]
MRKGVFSIGLIINTYEQPEPLARVLEWVSRQRLPPREVLLADDGSGPETRDAFGKWNPGPSPRKEHVWQEHQGFRRARILNEAIARAQSDYLVFLDGDTLPHPQFTEDHRKLARARAFLQGHRALVKERASAWYGRRGLAGDRWRALRHGQLGGLKHAFRWPRPWVQRREDLRGIRGCNLSAWREDLVQVNGFNEAFVGWGREDSELVVRLMNSGVRRLDVRGWAVCYHLWHPALSRARLPANDELLARAQREHATRCELGLSRHLPIK